MKPYFVGVVGHSGSGKTTLIVKLIEKLSKKGYTIGAVKHDAHSFEIDYPGKDSYRFKHSGAKRVVLSAKDKFAMIEDRDKEKPLDEIKNMFSDCDIVFIEGYKLADVDKIEVHRKQTNYEYLVQKGIKNIVMIASNEKIDFFKPVCDIDDINSIAYFIEELAKR